MNSSNNLEDNQVTSIFKVLSKSQKVAISFLGVLAVGVLVFWVYNFRASLTNPFPKTKNSDIVYKSVDLHNVDTDKDGLNDYDEINTYKTSIYLDDTDSDGVSDKEEVDKGMDPLCPQGQNCYTFNNEQVEENTSTSTNELNSESTVNGNNYSSEMIKKNISPDDLRAALVKAGADAGMVKKISDDDLINIYVQSLQSEVNNVKNNNQ